MKSLFFALLLVTNFAYGSSFGDCDVLFPKGSPPKIDAKLVAESRSLCFNDFAVLYSVKYKSPIYTIEKLSYLRKFLKDSRTNNFHEEMRLKSSERSTLNDYKKSGYDRGHLVPAADCTNMLCMSDSFSLSNMSAQTAQLNRKTWSRNVEMPTRKYVERASGDVYVFTGGYYGDNPKTIGASKVAVPEYMWKLVYDKQKNKSWVFWVKNDDEAKMTPPISYEEFVKRTGLKLLD